MDADSKNRRWDIEDAIESTGPPRDAEEFRQCVYKLINWVRGHDVTYPAHAIDIIPKPSGAEVRPFTSMVIEGPALIITKDHIRFMGVETKTEIWTP